MDFDTICLLKILLYCHISARSILASLLETHSASITDEGLCTLLVEVEGIINSIPLTAVEKTIRRE